MRIELSDIRRALDRRYPKRQIAGAADQSQSSRMTAILLRRLSGTLNSFAASSIAVSSSAASTCPRYLAGVAFRRVTRQRRWKSRGFVFLALAIRTLRIPPGHRDGPANAAPVT